LNSEFVLNQSDALVKRLRTTNADELAVIRNAYHLLFAREPSSSEAQMARDFLATAGKDAWTLYAQALLSSNEFVYVD
jgi:alpha-beta hydrolase superfamily lysophospholipase